MGTRLVLRMVGGEVGGGEEKKTKTETGKERKTEVGEENEDGERDGKLEGEDGGSGSEPWSLLKNVLEKVGGWVRVGEEVTRGVEGFLGGR